MSAHVFTANNIADLARKLDRSAGQLVGPESERFRLDLTRPADARAKVADHLAVLDSKHARRDSAGAPVRMDDQRRHDAATAFNTNALTTILAPEFQVSAYRFLFTPGFTGGGSVLLPVQQKVALGMQELAYDTVAFTGEARRMAAGATKDLRRVGTADDRKKQRVGMYGVRFGWDQFELWQAVHLGRAVESEQQRAASFAMAEYFEDFCSYGDIDTQRPGFFNHGSTITIELGTNMESVTDPDTMLSQLMYMHQAWKRANPNRMVSGVIMPEAHWANMVLLFKGADGEGAHAWTFAKTIFPWLNNVITDDRLLDASQDGFSMWQFWSADSESQYIEATTTPLLYGPFNDELETTFIMIGQIGGVVNKSPRAIMRVNFLS